MKVNNQKLSVFLLLTAIAVFVMTLDLPPMTLTRGENNVRFLDGDQRFVLIDPESGGSITEVEPGNADSPDSSCNLHPRWAILKFESFDINRADVESLTFIRGIGVKLAQRIIHRRERRGPFGRMDELLEVPGIGPSKLAALKESAVVCPVMK